MGRSKFALLALAAAVAPVSGCYTTGLRFSEGVRRVAVPVFGNESYVRGIELTMTERVRRVLIDRSEVELVRDAEQADTEIRGRVLRCNFPVLVGGTQPRILEGSAWIAVEAQLVETRTGKVLARVRGEDRAEFSTPLGESRVSALDELTEELAWKIVQGLSQRSRFTRDPLPGEQEEPPAKTPPDSEAPAPIGNARREPTK